VQVYEGDLRGFLSRKEAKSLLLCRLDFDLLTKTWKFVYVKKRWARG
jgi:hypothetical protein